MVLTNHLRVNQSRLVFTSRSRNSAYDLVKIEKRSRKRNHKLGGIGVGRIRIFSFSSDSAYDSVADDPVKTDYRSRKKRKNQPITRLGIEHYDWFILPPLLPTPTI